MFNGIMDAAGPVMKKRFADYKPKVSTDAMRDIVQIKKAGDRLLQKLLEQRAISKPMKTWHQVGTGWRQEEIMAKVTRGVVLDED